MSLNFDFSKVKDLELVKKNSAVTDALIWATMSVGISKITEDNATEFYQRLHLSEKLNGTHLIKDGKPRFITLKEVENRIGLYTNASNFSRAHFNKRQLIRYYGGDK